MNKDDPLYWRSLEELESTDEFRAFVKDEFPNRTPDWNDPASRRKALMQTLKEQERRQRKASYSLAANNSSSAGFVHYDNRLAKDLR